MQDNGQGFRTMDGATRAAEVTAWPSLLAVGATWDAPLTERFAFALGVEFRHVSHSTLPI